MKTAIISRKNAKYYAFFAGLLVLLIGSYFLDQKYNIKNSIIASYPILLDKSLKSLKIELTNKTDSSKNDLLEDTNNLSPVNNIENFNDGDINNQEQSSNNNQDSSSLKFPATEDSNIILQISELKNNIISEIDYITSDIDKLKKVNIDSEKLFVTSSLWRIEKAINNGASYYNELQLITKFVSISDEAIKLSLDAPPTIQTLYLDLLSLIDKAIKFEANSDTDSFLIKRFSNLIGLKYNGTEISGLKLQQYKVAASAQRIIDIANHLKNYSLTPEHPFQQWLLKFNNWQERHKWLKMLWSKYEL